MSKSRFLGCGLFLFVLFIGLLVLVCFFQTTKLAARRASGGNDLWEIWRACTYYAEDHEGRLPPLDKEPGRLVFDRHIMHDKYGVTGKTITMEYDENAPFRWEAYKRNPHLLENKDLLDDHSWWYLGYKISNEEEAFLFAKAYIKKAFFKGCIESDLETESGDGILSPLQLPLSHLAEIANAGYIEDATLATIPVFIERPGHYKGYSGGWVNYLDGHREYIDYPGRFPMTPQVIGMLRLLDDLGPIFRNRCR